MRSWFLRRLWGWVVTARDLSKQWEEDLFWLAHPQKEHTHHDYDKYYDKLLLSKAIPELLLKKFFEERKPGHITFK